MTERQAHIVQSSNGRTYDLTALETPFGLLPEDVQKALKDWTHGWEFWEIANWKSVCLVGLGSVAYRAKPAPQVKEYVLYWEAGFSAEFVQVRSDTHKITIRDDGTGKLDITGEKLK
jgi:hypothetical protein